MYVPLGIAFSPGGLLYGMDEATYKVYTINPTTGAPTLASTVTTGLNIVNEGDIAFSPNGTLYGGQDLVAGTDIHLFTVNLAGGTASLLPTTMSGTIHDLSAMAFDSLGNLWVYDQGVSKLYTINPTNGAILTSVDMSVTGTGGVAGMAFDPDTGKLYLATGGTTQNLFTVNTSTGAMTLIGTTDHNIAGLAFTPIGTPEPGTFLLMLAGAGIIAALRRSTRS